VVYIACVLFLYAVIEHNWSFIMSIWDNDCRLFLRTYFRIHHEEGMGCGRSIHVKSGFIWMSKLFRVVCVDRMNKSIGFINSVSEVEVWILNEWIAISELSSLFIGCNPSCTTRHLRCVLAYHVTTSQFDHHILSRDELVQYRCFSHRIFIWLTLFIVWTATTCNNCGIQLI